MPETAEAGAPSSRNVLLIGIVCSVCGPLCRSSWDSFANTVMVPAPQPRQSSETSGRRTRNILAGVAVIQTVIIVALLTRPPPPDAPTLPPQTCPVVTERPCNCVCKCERLTCPRPPPCPVCTDPPACAEHTPAPADVCCFADPLTDTEFMSKNAALPEPSDKTWEPKHVHDYGPMYQRVLGSFRQRCDAQGKPIKMLELGLGYSLSGTSKRLYEAYDKHVDYHVVEYNENATQGIKDTKNLNDKEKEHLLQRLKIGSSADPATLDDANRRWGPFDVIVDDASHQSDHIRAAFEHMFASSALKPGGWYVMEDLHVALVGAWGGTKEKQRDRDSILSLLQDIFLAQHYHWWQDPTMNKTASSMCPPYKPYSDNCSYYVQSMQMPFTLHADIADWVHSIECQREICAVRKNMVPTPHVIRQL